MIMKIGANETWKKVYGPIFIHLNSLSSDADNPYSLWEDAKQQVTKEAQSWPYDFPASEDYPKLGQRGTVSGRLLVLDRFISNVKMIGSRAHVGLAQPGDVGSWQLESKGYQFWVQADEDGYFEINGIRPGDYNLYAYVPGFIGDYKFASLISISPGCKADVGNLVYEPPRDGPTLWEIGIPDRTAAEFYVPCPNPRYVNPLYLSQDRLESSQFTQKKYCWLLFE
uniref:Rhamnogalacturonan lyase domain-containing protein n=1 Tax=Rhizophora mucronata TaxID=61149 RepID=A0A2P2J721_RHIMU